MKRIYTILVAVLITATVWAQVSEKMSYQAVVRDANNQLVTNTSVGMQISILQDSTTGTAVYVETQTPNTNANGLITIEIGTGTVVSGDFTTIDWANGPYFIKTETDLNGGANYTITGTSQLLSVPYALHAKTADSLINQHKYQVGDFAQGGIVFWVDETGEHGLVCAKEDQDGGSGIRWYAGTYGTTRAKGDGPYSGEINTAIIISSQISIGDDGADYAAQICNELQITEGGKTYGDWYLPSIEELNLMYQNKTIIDFMAISYGGSEFYEAQYWSSDEVDSNNAWYFGFFYGTPNNASKSNTYHVRAVRAF